MKTGKHKIPPEAKDFDCDNLAEIYDTYHLPIYRSIYRQVGEVETARDLSADVFYRLLQAVQARKGPSRDVKAWLYRTAHNIVVDHYRRRQFRRHDPLYKDFASDDLDPAQTAETHILAQSARHALNNLTPEQQQVISLKCLDGFSNNEVAAIMDKSTGAVKSLQHRALTALRRELILGEKPYPSGHKIAALPAENFDNSKIAISLQ